MLTETFINPFTDFGFKKLFGEEDSKPYLIDFLNSVFEGYIPYIAELNYSKNEHLGNTEIDRNAIFDLYCKNEKGERFIIELQKTKQAYFRERTLFYSTFAIQEQAEKGNEWNFKLDPIYCIGILNFKFHTNEQKYFHFGKILDIETHQPLINTLNFAYLECPKFNKQITKDSSNHDKWMYVLTKLDRLHNLPEQLQNKIFEGFFTKANILKLNTTEKEKYHNSIKYYRDFNNVIQTAKEEGLIEGETKKAFDIAKKMLARKIPIEYIIENTGLTENQIKTIKLET